MLQEWRLRRSKGRIILFGLEDRPEYGFVILHEKKNQISIGYANYFRYPEICDPPTYKYWLDLLYMISHEVLHIVISRIGEDEASTLLDTLLNDDGTKWYDWSGIPEGVPNDRHLPNTNHWRYH